MPNPRNVLDYTRLDAHDSPYKIDNSTITYDATKAGGSASVGLAVTLSTDQTVALAGDGEAVAGKLIKVEADNKATIQDQGYCQLPAGTSATLTIGLKFVGALLSSAKGYIKAASTGAEAGDKGRGRIIDNDVTTAVWVQL